MKLGWFSKTEVNGKGEPRWRELCVAHRLLQPGALRDVKSGQAQQGCMWVQKMKLGWFSKIEASEKASQDKENSTTFEM